MIYYQPEKIDALKQRFKECLLQVYSASSISDQPDNRPGQKRENIFDFEDGIRLIVSRDTVSQQEVIHFSASVNNDLYKGNLNQDLLQNFIKHFQELSGNNKPVKLAGFSKEGIPHFYIEISNLN